MKQIKLRINVLNKFEYCLTIFVFWLFVPERTGAAGAFEGGAAAGVPPAADADVPYLF